VFGLPELRSGVALGLVSMVGACSNERSSSEQRGSESSANASATSAASVASAQPPSLEPSASAIRSAPSAASAQPPPTSNSERCPADMRLVSGNYCPVPSQVCLEWNEVNVTGVPERQQCKRYREPSDCLSKQREPMSFCMDTFEWPNQRGVIPRNLTSWQEAKDTCESIGKRLCTDVEFTFACEGEAMRPHVTGFVRDKTKCSFDREYRKRTFNFLKHDACLAEPACKAALEAIDQRLPAGSMPECVSEHGVYDLNGNVNEWTLLPGRGFSKRAGLKGGWWGPVRDRCRPITTFHGESDYGYEVGFRCCRDPLR
jgi:hypothetical protein